MNNFHTICHNPEHERLKEAAIEQMRRFNRPIVLNFDITMAVGLIGQLQLAFRHPENQGHLRDVLEKTVRVLINQLDPSHGALFQLLMLGFEGDCSPGIQEMPDIIG